MQGSTRTATTCLRAYSRQASTLVPAHNSSFSSYFFNNAQWQPSSSSKEIVIPQKPPLSSFKPVEALTPTKLIKIYSQLSKFRLTTSMTLTAMAGVALAPSPVTVHVLLATAAGTALCSASANTLNQLQEVPFDAQMARTRNRPLVRRAISPLHATGFAIVSGLGGTALLAILVNPMTAILGFSNIALYAGAYTWMKRKSIWNTWVGAIVGAIPPIMGWVAGGGHLLPSSTQPLHLFLPFSQITDMSLLDNPIAPFAFFMLLFSWQFPHFMPLAHLVRGSYAQAGYQMLAILNPVKNALVSLRHALLLFPICSILIPISGLTTWAFALTTLVPNTILLRAAWRFWKTGAEKEARITFRHSLWYTPVVMALMMLHKHGLDWSQWWKGDEKDTGESENQA